MENEPQDKKDSYIAKHRRFQHIVAALFLGCALIVMGSIFAFSRPEGIAGPAVLLFVQLPLFLILALVGLNALIRAAKGPRRK